MTYQEQLKHPRWQKKRLEVLEASSFTCQGCGATEKTLNVHHKAYIKGRKAWEYEVDELQCLCEDCHQKTHVVRAEIAKLTADLTENALHAISGYIKALMAANGFPVADLVNQAEGIGASDYFRVNPYLAFDKMGDGHSLSTHMFYETANDIHAGRFQKRRG